MERMEKREVPTQIPKAEILASFRCRSPFLGMRPRGNLKNAIPANLRRSQALAYFWGLVGVDPSKL